MDLALFQLRWQILIPTDCSLFYCLIYHLTWVAFFQVVWVNSLWLNQLWILLHKRDCCSLSAGVAPICMVHHERNVSRRTIPIYMWRTQAIAEWSWRVFSTVACCHSAKLCAKAARAFWLQQNGAVTRTWRLFQVQPSHKEHVISAVSCKKERMLLQPLCWHCTECAVHHEQNVRKEQHPCKSGMNKQ